MFMDRELIVIIIRVCHLESFVSRDILFYRKFVVHTAFKMNTKKKLKK